MKDEWRRDVERDGLREKCINGVKEEKKTKRYK